MVATDGRVARIDQGTVAHTGIRQKSAPVVSPSRLAVNRSVEGASRLPNIINHM